MGERLGGYNSFEEDCVSKLDWSETSRGVECAGYRIVLDRSINERPWRLEVVGPWSRQDRTVAGTVHRSLDDAISWAEWTERDRIRRCIAATHFVLAAVASTLFVAFSQFIGSLGGLLLVAGALYVALRSIGNGLGVLLNDAWGWTRHGRSHSSALERIVPAAVSWLHIRRAALIPAEPLRSVRELPPPPHG